jgi:gamma-glutamyl-gamma-aminobutyrate hydrolase PuuD
MTKLASVSFYDEDTEHIATMLGMESYSVTKPDDLKPDSLVVFWGGEDIATSFYGETPSKAESGYEKSGRDLTEEAIFNRAVEMGLPILAICRGAQLACCLLGGKLYQHVDGHAGYDHPVVVGDKQYMTNSYHHQMMIPSDDMEVIGYAKCRSRIKWKEEPVIDEGDEAEIVYHRGKNVLMIQGHPEWVPPSHDLYGLTQRLVKEYLNV